MGITSAEGKYLGAVTLGFAIDGLAKKLNSAIGMNTLHFVILTKDFKYVGGTMGGKPTDDKYFFVRDLESKTGYFAEKNGFFKEPIAFGNEVYPYYQKTSKYGYIILTGYNKNLPNQIFNEVVLPRILEFLILGTIVILLLLIFKKRTVEPLLHLSKIVEKISKGEKIQRLPKSNVIEIRTITKQFINVLRYMNREKHHKKLLIEAKAKAEHAVIIAREAKAAKEEFLRKLRHELKVPLTTILGYAEIMIGEKLGQLPAEYKGVAENIFKSGYQIGTLMTSVLSRKLIETATVLKECVAVHQDDAYLKKINYSLSISDNLPCIYVDEVRFRQIIVGIIHHSLTLTPAGENIHISSHVIMKEQQPGELVITLQDTGFGGDEDFRKNAIDKMGPQGLSRNSDGTDLTIDNIRTLLALHQGTLTIESENRNGTTFIVKLPYLEERDESFTAGVLTIAEDATINKVAKKQNAYAKHSNVTPFRNKKKDKNDK